MMIIELTGQVYCFFCGARPSEPCTYGSGLKVYGTHSARENEAKRIYQLVKKLEAEEKDTRDGR
jgi:hypothetical protein